jgi:reductive dehalogenase
LLNISLKGEEMKTPVRKLTKDNPPYQVNEHLYKRFDMRKALNPMVMATTGFTALVRVQKGGPGFSRLGLAFEEGAWTVANAFGSFNLFGDKGLIPWEPLKNVGFHGAPDYAEELGPWDYQSDGWSIEKVTQRVKKVAKLYGASLVGIGEVDQRWFYANSIYMDMDELLRGEMSKAEAKGEGIATVEELTGRDIVFRAMQSMDKDQLKNLVIRTVEKADPSIRPDGVSPIAAKTMPAGMLKSMLPTVVPTFSVEFLHVLATEISPDLLPKGFNPDSILEADIEVEDISKTMPAGEIRFVEDIKAPVHDREKGIQMIPTSMKYSIVMAFEMDPDAMTLKHSFESAAVTANAYSRMAFTASCLAQFIRQMGYHAIPMNNDTAMSVPMAVDAGLGELSRAGWLITPKYGPRVRLAKVITDMPLAIDGPMTFGVTEFCEICGKCAKQCPASAIQKGERSYDAPPTGNPGVLKWAINGAKCLKYWANSGACCSQCIVACPFNKSQGWIHDMARLLISARSGFIDKIFLTMDDALGYGKAKSPEDFWERENYMHIN